MCDRFYIRFLCCYYYVWSIFGNEKQNQKPEKFNFLSKKYQEEEKEGEENRKENEIKKEWNAEK